MNSRMPDLERLVPAHVKCFEAYIPSKPDDVLMEYYGVKRLLRLNNNENPLGPPAESREAITKFPTVKASVYPSGDAFHLRQLLAARFKLDPDQFLVGNGANEVIAFVIKAFCQEGDNIVTADKTFAVYEWVARFSGYEARCVPLRDYGFDDEAMLTAADERTKIFFVCNPNNPTGTYWSKKRLTDFLDRVDRRAIVVVDEAYLEFVEEDDFPDAMDLIGLYPNVVSFRTFSKMYGLAGLRIGYLCGAPEIVDIIRKTCVVYSVNTLAQVAAIEAVNADHHVAATRKAVREARDYLTREFGKMGLFLVSGQGCYMMARLPMSDSLAYRKLMAKGLMIRTMTGFRFPNFIRVSFGAMEDMEELVRGMREILPSKR
ncbi:MAG: histidinol-phosphate transaminase [Deltaproteobacteria bacterium]|nr:histidinol-phosphate transaminase [Deltaproteobacteria bacterium]